MPLTARIVFGPIVGVLVLALLPATAMGSTVRMSGLANQNLKVIYTADNGEENDLSIMKDSTDFIIADPGATAGISPDGETAQSACREGTAPTDPPGSVRCTATKVRLVDVNLGDRDDHLKIVDPAEPPIPPLSSEYPITANGGPGNDVLSGGAAREKLIGEDGIDTLAGADNDDGLYGGPDGDHLDGGAGDDIVQGQDGNDDIVGGPGDDKPLWGNTGNDEIDGGEGDDELRGGRGDDHLRGGTGNDQLDFFWKVVADDAVGEDSLDGGPGDDALSGGPPRDDDTDRQDPDVLIGGDGTDSADFSERTASLKIDLDGRGDDGESGEHDNVDADVGNLIGGTDSDTLTGSGAANFIDGRNGDDRISGSGGDDTLDGGANNPGSDTLNGGGGRDTLNGRAGDDSLDGGEGDDVLSGSGGTDKLDGDDGNDSLDGGAGGDALDGGPGNDMLDGAEADLIGADGADDLAGGPGADVLLGRDGNDELDGGSGPDPMSGGAGRDTVDYENRSSPVTVTLDGMPNDGEKNENDNVGRDVEIVLGGTVGDTLFGDGDANRLDGGSGEDFLVGNAGIDILEGGDAPDLVQARDGRADVVACGEEGDLAIVDRRDTVRGCETVDRGGKRRLVVGDSALVRPSQVPFGLRLPNGHRYYQLEDSLKFPIGSTIDARNGAVRLATARNRNGARQEISVLGGPFSVRQEAGKRPTTDLRLVGGPRGCARSSNGPRAPTDVRVPTLDATGDKRKRANYRVKGKHSTAAPKGTSWVTEERCDGTFTRVRSGTVNVRDLERNRTVVLHAGDTYLARPR
jgi:Ca2+-binding RTX toxin-like protein